MEVFENSGFADACRQVDMQLFDNDDVSIPLAFKYHNRRHSKQLNKCLFLRTRVIDTIENAECVDADNYISG